MFKDLKKNMKMTNKHVGIYNREIETIKKNQMSKLELQSIYLNKEKKSSLISDWIMQKKESINLKIDRQKLSKAKCTGIKKYFE